MCDFVEIIDGIGVCRETLNEWDMDMPTAGELKELLALDDENGNFTKWTYTQIKLSSLWWIVDIVGGVDIDFIDYIGFDKIRTREYVCRFLNSKDNVWHELFWDIRAKKEVLDELIDFDGFRHIYEIDKMFNGSNFEYVLKVFRLMKEKPELFMVENETGKLTKLFIECLSG